jgi:hypothetical protein
MAQAMINMMKQHPAHWAVLEGNLAQFMIHLDDADEVDPITGDTLLMAILCKDWEETRDKMVWVHMLIQKAKMMSQYINICKLNDSGMCPADALNALANEELARYIDVNILKEEFHELGLYIRGQQCSIEGLENEWVKVDRVPPITIKVPEQYKIETIITPRVPPMTIRVPAKYRMCPPLLIKVPIQIQISAAHNNQEV